jgi:hypothetical protein
MTMLFMIVIVFYYSNEQRQEEKKRHEDDDCVSSSLCLRGAGREGKGETIIDRHCLLFFTRVMTMIKMT